MRKAVVLDVSLAREILADGRRCRLVLDAAAQRHPVDSESVPPQNAEKGNMQLFHLSEDPNITVFEPRPANRNAWPNLPQSYVWAVSDEMVHNYYFPRFCPRACRMIGPTTSQVEKGQFVAEGFPRSIIYAEESWKPEIRNCILYRYEFRVDGFYAIDFEAGYYVSEDTQQPIERERISNVLDLLDAMKVKIVWVSNITPFARSNAESGYRFSNIQMNNAGRAAGIRSFTGKA